MSDTHHLRRGPSEVVVLVVDTPGIGDRSYLVHDGEVALVVDPQRDIDRILRTATDAGVRISHVAETHVHNDYVSGGLALARRVGAELLGAAENAYSFEWRGVSDGDVIAVGRMRLHVIHTPGHTHHHLSYAIAGPDDVPLAVFTGGSLLYGTVGRTDLLGEDETDELTRAQWSSARRLGDALPDDVAVFPTHGFGSFCSSQGGADRKQSTLGLERSDNLVFEIDDADEFVERLLAGLGDHPAYYAHMSLLNRAGASEPDLSPPAEVDPDEVRRRLDDGEWVLDLRDRRAYAHRHLVGTAGFEIDGPFVTYVGWLIPWGSRLTLISDSADDVTRAQRELCRIGIDRPAGATLGDVEDSGAPTASYRVADFGELADALGDDGMRIVDVRRQDEWQEGHIDGAVNVPIHQLLDHLHHVPTGTLWVHCASGARAAIATSLLDRAGHDVVLVDDSFEHAADAGLTVTDAGHLDAASSPG